MRSPGGRSTLVPHRGCLKARLVFAVVMATSGCAGSLRLHSETREAQGWGDVDLDGFFAAERANQVKLLEAELASTARIVAVNRESEIRVLAVTPINDLSKRYDSALGPMLRGDGKISVDDLSNLVARVIA